MVSRKEVAQDAERRERDDIKGRPRGRFDLRTVVLGLQSGLVATVVMTLFRMPISRSPPPTANFWAKYVAGGEPEDHAVVGMALHLAYGTFGGLLFAMLSPIRPSGSEVEDEARGVVRGLAYGLLMSAFGARFVLEGLLDMDLDPDERFVFHVSHAIYGLTLGAWVGANAD